MRNPTLTINREARAALLAVVSHGLPSMGNAPASIGPLDDYTWRSLLAAVHVERVAGLLDRAVADGAIRSTPGQAEDAEVMSAQSIRSVLHLERSLLAVADCLTSASVPFLVLKGPAVARLDEPEPALRQYADIDILVRGPDVTAAVAALAGIGYRRDLPERRPGFDRRFGKEVSLRAERGGPELDLHRTLALGAFGLRIEVAALWEATVALQLGGAHLAALDAEGRFVHACVNAMLGDERPRLVALRDVARISTTHALRPARLQAIVPEGRGGAVVSAAVAACRSTLGLDVGSTAAAFAATAAPSHWERVAFRAYRSQGGSNTLELLSGALGARGHDRLRYLRALVAPHGTYRSARRRAGRPGEWGTGLQEVLVSGLRRRRSSHGG